MSKGSKLTAAEIADLQLMHGANTLYIDHLGNIVDKRTGKAVDQNDMGEAEGEVKDSYREFFRKQPAAVKEAIIKEALAHKVAQAIIAMDNHELSVPDKPERWRLSYEELVKIAAEGILLDDV